MKTLIGLVLLALITVPVSTSAQATDLSGNWNATFTMTRPDGSSQSITFTFHFTQKGKTLTGTIGPTPERQWKVEKGLVDGAKVSFEVEQPEGPTQRSFALTLVKGRLEGTMKLARGAQTGEAKVEAERAK
jgi:hypothetical protein